jgi:hypothetical protein
MLIKMFTSPKIISKKQKSRRRARTLIQIGTLKMIRLLTVALGNFEKKLKPKGFN